jgi:hypothetical protein
MRTAAEPQSAAWHHVKYEDVPIDEDQSCWQVRCKTAIRRTHCEDPVAGPSRAKPVKERMWDIIPAGHDSLGNEISFATFLQSRLPDDCPFSPAELEACMRTYGEITGDIGDLALRLYGEYENWYEREVPIAGQLRTYTTKEPGSCVTQEHIAGPTCVAAANAHAYSGYQLSYEEMEACTTVQTLRIKPDDVTVDLDVRWKPSAAEDDEFERTGKYYLTGLGDGPGAIEEPAPCFLRRHGAEYVCGSDARYEFGGNSSSFHPYCLEVYKRVSLLHRGDIGIDELASKFRRDALGGLMHPAVYSASVQWWLHKNGSEFLVANPVHIPALRDILERATKTEGDDFDNMEDTFSKISVVSTSNKREDIFTTLPQELRNDILDHLPSKDIANLRRTSSSFRGLSNKLWRRLVLEDMPWLWEAWCERHYPLWACTTVDKLESHERSMRAKSKASLALPDEQRTAMKAKIRRARKNFRKPKPAQLLDPIRTDWQWLYCELERERMNIKGLRNRERIWVNLVLVVKGTEESREVVEKLYADYEQSNAR